MTENVNPQLFVQLPYELQCVEMILAHQFLPASRVDELELMYRCGWAAAIAEMDGDRTQHSPIDTSIRSAQRK